MKLRFEHPDSDKILPSVTYIHRLKEEMDREFDRQFYAGDEEGAHDIGSNPFLGTFLNFAGFHTILTIESLVGDESKFEKKKQELVRNQGRKLSARASQYHEDNRSNAAFC